jgi:hemerythrin
MREFNWLESYKVGHSIVDQQHQNLFELANRLVDANKSETLTKYAMLLYRHVREHFQCEEELMKQVRYPGYLEHVQAHNELLNQLVIISDSIHNQNWKPENIKVFMRDWILVHILELDMLLGEYLRKHQNSETDEPLVPSM